MATLTLEELAAYLRPHQPIAGLDLGTAKTITKARYVPRAGLASRMVGGKFQASTDGAGLPTASGRGLKSPTPPTARPGSSSATTSSSRWASRGTGS